MKKFTPEWWASLTPEVAGKETERLVEAALYEANKFQGFAWHRLPDSKSARNVMAAQPADYLFSDVKLDNQGFLEVKALKHDYRLPASRLSQHATLNKWAKATFSNYVLVHHYMTGLWRRVCVKYLEFGVPSWNLSEYQTYNSAHEAMRGTIYRWE